MTESVTGVEAEDMECEDSDGDNDDDGSVGEFFGGDDCDDDDPNTFVGAAEDESTTECMTDADGDGWGSATPKPDVAVGTDCDDFDALLNFDDNDADGYFSCDGDCDDEDASVTPSNGCDPPSLEGWEILNGKLVMSDLGVNVDCEYIWGTSGTPYGTMCTDCLFAFEVVRTLDKVTDSSTLGVCELADFATGGTYVYGFSEDYSGSGTGTLWLEDYYGTWYDWASADFDDATGTFTYSASDTTLYFGYLSETYSMYYGSDFGGGAYNLLGPSYYGYAMVVY